jgi:hypothetical protein
VEEIIDSLVSIGMGAAHEAITDQSDIQWFFSHREFSVQMFNRLLIEAGTRKSRP